MIFQCLPHTKGEGGAGLTWREEQIGDARLILGDCREVLLHGGSMGLYGLDAAVTSPPYNQNIDKFKPSGMHKESRWVEKISSGYSDSMEESDYQDWQVS